MYPTKHPCSAYKGPCSKAGHEVREEDGAHFIPISPGPVQCYIVDTHRQRDIKNLT